MRKAPIVHYALALAFGIWGYDVLPEGGNVAWALFGTGATLLARGFYEYRAKKRPRNSLFGVGPLLMSVVMGWATAHWHTAARQPDNILHVANLDAYEGTVAALPEARAKTWRIELALRRGRVPGADSQKHYVPLSGRVLVYLDKSAPLPRYGERWWVLGPPRPIDPPLNPGELDYRRFLAHRNIYHQQYLRPHQRRIIGYAPPNRLTALAFQVNTWADSVFTARLGERTDYGLVSAMLLGIRDDLDAEQYRAYAIAGAVHILSVSGLHVGILFAVLTFALRPLGRRRGMRVGVMLSKLSVLWFYALMAGFSPPVLRSAAMFSLFIIAEGANKLPSGPHLLGASAFGLLWLEPGVLFSAGFQLSLLAVAGIGAWAPALQRSISVENRWGRALWNVTAVALVAQLATFPLAVYYFHQFPLYFWLANPVVLLLSNALLPAGMILLAVSWVPGLSNVVAWAVTLLTRLLNATVTAMGQLPAASLDGLWLNVVQLLLLYALILVIVQMLRLRERRYVWVVAGLSVGLGSWWLWQNVATAHQRRLAVHFLPHKTAVSLTTGRSATLLTDLNIATDPRSFGFYLKNTFSSWGVALPTVVSIRTDSLLRLQTAYQTKQYVLWIAEGRSVLLLNSLRGNWRLSTPIDVLILRKNALQHWQQLRGRVQPRRIVFDDSNKTPLTDRLLAEARRAGILCHSVRQQQTFRLDF